MLLAGKKMKNKIIYGLFLMIVLINSIFLVYAVSDEDVKNVLKRSLLEYFENPADINLDLQETKDILNFYLTIPKGQDSVDLSQTGSNSGKKIEEIFSKALTSTSITKQHNEKCSSQSECNDNLFCKLAGDYPDLAGSKCCYSNECSSSDGCMQEGAIFFRGSENEITCEDGEWKTPEEDKTINLIALKFSGWKIFINDYNFENNLPLVSSLTAADADYNLLKNKIEDILNDDPNIDLFVTPEFTFFSKNSFSSDDAWIKIKELNDGTYDVYEASHSDLSIFIDNIKNLANQHNSNFVLGTFSEHVDSDEPIGDFRYNTQLIINNEGKIVAIHRKCFGCSVSFQIIKQPDRGTEGVEDFILDTLKPVTLTSHKGFQFEILPLICQERHKEELYEYEMDFNVDIVAISQAEGDDFYDWISEYLQTGDIAVSNQINRWWSCEIKKYQEYWYLPYKENRDLTDQICYGTNKWTWSGREYDVSTISERSTEIVDNIYQKEYLGRNIMKDSGYIIGSDGAGGQGGVFSVKKEKLNKLEIKPDYVFATVEIT